MPEAKFEVVPFGEKAFFRALANRHVTAEEVAALGKPQQLFGYVSKLKPATMVIEPSYTDGDYLDDVAEFYVKCFDDFDRRCTRIHFFGFRFTRRTLLRAIQHPGAPDRLTKRLRNGYLGFVVSRPLPSAIIGRTVLATYGSDNDRRHYPAIRRYEANLFGLDLPIQSLAFQEQDTVLAACATVAVWSAFQKTSELFGTASLTPAKITHSASRTIHNGRPIPSQGLNLLEMCNAVRAVGLEPEVFAIAGNTPVLSLIYGYLRIGLPVILGVDIQGVGGHAITVAGYSLRTEPQVASEVATTDDPPLMVGERIDRLYAHDDQICPFAKIEALANPKVGPPVRFMASRQCPMWFSGSWRRAGAAIPIFPEHVIIPVYPKIRLKFLDARSWLVRLGFVPQVTQMLGMERTEWDLHLAFSNKLKAQVRLDPAYSPGLTKLLLLSPHPRFVWRAVLREGKNLLMEVLIDATGMERSVPVYCVLWHDRGLASDCEDLMRGFETQFRQKLTAPFYEFVLKSAQEFELIRGSVVRR